MLYFMIDMVDIVSEYVGWKTCECIAKCAHVASYL